MKYFFFSILIFGSGFLAFSWAFSMGLDSHYDVEKGSLFWHFIMDESIKKIPIISATNIPVYHHIGGDAPGIAAGYELMYSSSERIKKLENSIASYLKEKEFETRKVVDGNDILIEGLHKEKEVDVTLSYENDSTISVKVIVLM